MEPLRVLLLLRALEVGGSERQAATLAAGLAACGHDVGVLTFYGDGPLAAGLAEAGVDLWTAGKRGRGDVPGFLWRLGRAIRKFRPDVVYSFLPGANVVAAAAMPLAGMPPMVWGVRCADVDLSGVGRLTRLAYGAERLLSRLPRRIVANSRRGAEVLRRRGYPGDRIEVIPNGIDTARFRFDAEGRARMRAAWGIAEGQRVVGIAARIDPVKDHVTYLRAAARLRDRDDLRFVCVGPGPADLVGVHRRLAEELGIAERVVWAGGQSNMPAVYSAFDLATLASTSEGFPNGLAEAMACGVPCAATDAGDSAWLMGETGCVVPVGDDGALAEAWCRMLDGGRLAELGQAARDRIVEGFGVAALCGRTEAVLRAAAGRG
ncbi:MAG: glycosyltransferase [Pseudomonadota bacterium]